MDIVTYAAARKFVEETAVGLGAVKGAPCTISKIEEDTDGNTVITFSWKGTDGTIKTSVATIKKGIDAASIVSVVINEDNHLIVTLSDGTELDGGEFLGGSTLKEDLTATVEIGTVSSGKKYPAGTPLEDIIRDMLIKEEPPAVTLSLIPSDPLYDIVNDTVASITIVAAVAQKTYPLDRIRFFVDDVDVSTQTITASGSYQYVYNPDTPINSDTTFKVIVMDEKLSTTVTKKIKFVGRTFYGIAPSDIGEPTEAFIKSLSTTLKDVKGYKYAGITTDFGKVVYAYPKSFGDLTSIKDLINNFDYTASFSKTVLDVDGIAYNCYIQVDPSAATNVELTFA